MLKLFAILHKLWCELHWSREQKEQTMLKLIPFIHRRWNFQDHFISWSTYYFIIKHVHKPISTTYNLCLILNNTFPLMSFCQSRPMQLKLFFCKSLHIFILKIEHKKPSSQPALSLGFHKNVFRFQFKHYFQMKPCWVILLCWDSTFYTTVDV